MSGDIPMCKLAAIVLAAGLSTRMGTPKIFLPWGKSTIIEAILEKLNRAGVEEIVIVGGSFVDELRKKASAYSCHVVYNPDFANGEMMCSLRRGVRALQNDHEAILVVLGDQPQIEVNTIREMTREFISGKHPVVVPSYHMKRGHPWLFSAELTETLLSSNTMREFLNNNPDIINYVVVDTPTVNQDIDTLEDYQKYRPEE